MSHSTHSSRSRAMGIRLSASGGRNHQGESHFMGTAAAFRSDTVRTDGSLRQPRSSLMRRRALLVRTKGIWGKTMARSSQKDQRMNWAEKRGMNRQGTMTASSRTLTHPSCRR